MAAITVFSVGHSTHEFDEFAALLEKHGIETVADVRTVPKSRKFPQFHTDSLAESLPGRGIAYRHLARLGGWRKTDPESPNDGWRNRSFRGYADYTMTSEFGDGLAELRTIAAEHPTAIMCSEALWWRCHRRLIADRLVSGGDTVGHIGSDGKLTAHELTGFAVIDENGRITYPAGETE